MRNKIQASGGGQEANGISRYLLFWGTENGKKIRAIMNFNFCTAVVSIYLIMLLFWEF